METRTKPPCDTRTSNEQHHPYDDLPRGPYQYGNLRRGKFFRYIILLPGKDNEPLRCKLRTSRLRRNTFEAISYVWGSSVKNQEIICDEHVLKITTSLSNVLKRLRLSDTRRFLWVDGICINQEDLEEKNYQVAIMGQIYRSAKCVLIYIGADDEGHGQRLCSFVNEANQMIDDTCKRIDMSAEWFPWPKEDDPLLTDDRWESFKHFLSQEWFHRGWVVREATVAQYGIIIWGQSELDWVHFMKTYYWSLSRTPTYHIQQDMCVPAYLACCAGKKHFMEKFNGNKSMQTVSLLEVLQWAKALHLYDPRDRIYAFMELSNEPGYTVAIQPNYEIHHLEVYWQFAIQHIQSTASAHILSHALYTTNTTVVEKPSWVPRWDQKGCYIPTRAAIVDDLTSRDGSICVPTLIDDRTLRVRGAVLDTVIYTSSILYEHSTDKQTIMELWKVVKEISENSPYKSSAKLDILLEALCVGRNAGEVSKWYEDRRSFMFDIQLELEGPVSGETIRTDYSDENHVGVPNPHTLDSSECSSQSSNDMNFQRDGHICLEIVGCFSNVTRFFVTERGYMGLAPTVIEEGDTCGIIFGCTTPFILRSATQEQRYELIAGVYLVGNRPCVRDGYETFPYILGEEASKDWVDWDVEEQDIYLI